MLSKVPEALRFLRDALKLEPRHHSSCLGLATLLMAMGESDRALQFFRRAVSLRPRHAHSHYRLGCTYRERGEGALAVVCLGNAAKLAPGNAGLRLQLARALVQERRFDDALREFRAAIEMDGYAIYIILNHIYIDECIAMPTHFGAIFSYMEAIIM